MAILQASWIAASSHPADTDRLVLEGLLNPPGAPVSGARYGVGSGTTELAVTENATPNMTVNVAAGHCWIDGTENNNQGAYHLYNDATLNLAIAAADPTNPRKDLVVARIKDAAYSGATNAGSVEVVTGTAAASPAEPTVPANSVVLALVDVPAADTAITNSQITDRRRRTSALGGIVVCTSGTRPTSGIYEGLFIYETDNDRVYVYTGAAWTQIGLLDDPASCRVRIDAGSAIANGVETAIPFSTAGAMVEDWDTQGMHDGTTNPSRLTSPAGWAGLYLVTASGEFDPNATGVRQWWIRKNGSATNANLVAEAKMDVDSTGTAHGVSLSGPIKLAVGDYVEFRVLQNSGGNLDHRNNIITATWLGRG